MKMQVKKRFQDHEGTTLVELTVVLCIITFIMGATVTLGSAAFENLRTYQYHCESEALLIKLINFREERMMTSRKDTIYEIYVFEKKVLFVRRPTNPTFGEYEKTEVFNLQYMQIQGTMLGEKFEIFPSGTLGKAGTMEMIKSSKAINLKGDSGEQDKIVFQVGNGRIYLDEQ